MTEKLTWKQAQKQVLPRDCAITAFAHCISQHDVVMAGVGDGEKRCVKGPSGPLAGDCSYHSFSFDNEIQVAIIETLCLTLWMQENRITAQQIDALQTRWDAVTPPDEGTEPCT